MTTLATHQLSLDSFLRLAAGECSAETMRTLMKAELSKQVVLVRGVRDTARALGHPQAGEAEAAYRALAVIQAAHPAEVEGVLRHPAVGAWAKHTILAMRRNDPAALPAQLSAVAAAAAIRSGAEYELPVPVVDDVVTLPSLGQATGFGGADRAVACSHATGAAVGDVALPADPATEAPGWTGLRRLRATAHGMSIDLLIDDLDPYRMPGYPGLGGRLSAERAATWQWMLEDAWELLTAEFPEAAEEIALAIRVLTPFADSGDRHTSASSRDAFGCIGLSNPPDARFLALGLIHEEHHNKLSAVLDIVRLLEPDERTVFYAPWREDPRPLDGLLQGAFAHMAIAGFWRHLHRTDPTAQDAEAEYLHWRDATHRTVRTLLTHATPTEEGKLFLTRMDEVLSSWSGDMVSLAARDKARRDAEAHLTAWSARNPDKLACL